MNEKLRALYMLPQEKRDLIAKVLREQPALSGRTRYYGWLEKEIKRRFDLDVPDSTISRVFHGGSHPYESRLESASPGQARAIVALFRYFNLDLDAVLAGKTVDTAFYPSGREPAFDDAPHLFFPDSPAFAPYSKTRISDCGDEGALGQLFGSCKKALAGSGKTDGHDALRIVEAEKHLRKVRETRKQQTLPLVAGNDKTHSAPVATVKHVEVAPDRNGFSIDASKALIKQLEDQGLPTAEIKAAIIQRVTADKSSMERLVSSMLGF